MKGKNKIEIRDVLYYYVRIMKNRLPFNIHFSFFFAGLHKTGKRVAEN